MIAPEIPCFLFGHDLGASPDDVAWIRSRDGMKLHGFLCTRCECLIGDGRKPWVGAFLHIVMALSALIVIAALVCVAVFGWSPWLVPAACSFMLAGLELSSWRGPKRRQLPRARELVLERRDEPITFTPTRRYHLRPIPGGRSGPLN